MLGKLNYWIKRVKLVMIEEISRHWILFSLMVLVAICGTLMFIEFDRVGIEYIFRERDPNTLKLMRKISRYGGFQGVLIFVSVVYFAGWVLKSKRLQNGAFAALIASYLAGGTSNIVKFVTGRPRPKVLIFEGGVDGLYGISFCSKYRSFPSAHTACVFGAAAGLTAIYARAGFPSFALATLVCYSRYYTLNHYLSDIFFSIVLGLFFGVLCAAVTERMMDG